MPPATSTRSASPRNPREPASHIAAEVLAATPDAAALRFSLAQSIDDPGLTLLFPRDDSTVIDAAGQPVRQEPGAAVATVRWPSRPVAEVRYRAELARRCAAAAHRAAAVHAARRRRRARRAGADLRRGAADRQHGAR